MPLSPQREIQALIDGLEEAFQRRSWHGTNLLGTIRGLNPHRALWRPQKKRHNIWELVTHAAYWKYAVTRRLTGGPRGAFPLAGSNFFPRDQGSIAEWKHDVHILKQCHAKLLEVVWKMPKSRLPEAASGPGKWTAEEMIRGVGVHDLYHAGQIQLLKRLYENA
jgi:hypothetical protein